MSADVESARRLVERWPALSAADLAELCDADVEYTWVPVGIAGHGVAELGGVLASSAAQWEMRGEIDHLAVGDGVVMVARTVFFDHLDGRRDSFAVPVLGVFEMHDGKVLRWRDYLDRTHCPIIG